jgi:hypothetical protein
MTPHTYDNWTIKISAMAFLGDLALFQSSGLPVHRFSSNQKYFFINTNSVKGFLIAAAPIQRLLEAS